MKQLKWFSFLIMLSLCYGAQIYAGREHCPKEAIHCIYNITNSPPKWIKIVMLPKNLTMVLCLSNQDVVYLEKDDVEQDGTLPGTSLTWTLSQCVNEKCHQSQPLGIDQFVLLLTEENYDAKPHTYGFTLDPAYGETCAFPKGRMTQHHYEQLIIKRNSLT